MANVVQMGVDAFWGQLSALSERAKQLSADLEADKLTLQHAYSATRSDPDPRRRALHQSLLAPQIHNNSVLRLRYRDLSAKFNAAVQGASAVLKRAGLSTSELAGLGAIQLVPVVAVAALLTALAIYGAVRLQTDAQRRATSALIQILNDPTATPEEKRDAAAALRKVANQPPPDLFGALAPMLGLVALIVIGPPLLRMFDRRAA